MDAFDGSEWAQRGDRFVWWIGRARIVRFLLWTAFIENTRFSQYAGRKFQLCQRKVTNVVKYSYKSVTGLLPELKKCYTSDTSALQEPYSGTALVLLKKVSFK